MNVHLLSVICYLLFASYCHLPSPRSGSLSLSSFSADISTPSSKSALVTTLTGGT